MPPRDREHCWRLSARFAGGRTTKKSVFLFTTHGWGPVLLSFPPYNMDGRGTQGLMGYGGRRHVLRSGGKFSTFGFHRPPALGCPLVDDRVALKQRVKEANDIVDVVGSYIALRPVGPTFKGVCPFHDDHRPSLDVDPRKQRYKCWACDKHGDVIKFVQEFVKVGFREAWKYWHGA